MEMGVLSVAVGVAVVAVAVAGMVVVVVVVVAVAVGCATRIQHRTPRLRPRAPSTPISKDDEGSLYEREIIAVSYSVPSCGMNRSNPESGVAATAVATAVAVAVIF